MRYYLSTAFCLSILAMAPSLFGQKNYLPGTVTKIDGITQTGWVDYKNWHKNPRSILFKSENGQEAQLSYIDVASFEVMRPDKELERYKRAIVQVDISPTKTDELDDNPLPIFKTDTILLRVLVEGNLDLYFLIDEAEKFHFFYGSAEGGEIKELVHKEYVKQERDTRRVGVNYHYRKQLLDLAQDCKKISSKEMAALRFEMAAIIKIAKAINECFGSKPSYVFQAEKQRFDFHINGGLNFHKYDIDSEDTNVDGAEFDLCYGLTAGIGMKWQIPRTQGKLLVFGEINYAQLKAEGLYIKPLSTLGFTHYNSKLETYLLSLQLGPEWRFYNGKFTTYAKPAIVLSSVLKTSQSGNTVIHYKDGHTSSPHNYTLLQEVRKNTYGILFGLGTCLPGGHWQIEAQLYWNNGVVSNSYSNDEFKSLGILMGYKF